MAVSTLSDYIPVEWLRFVISSLSVFYRYQNFAHGVFDIAALVYYLSLTGLFLTLSVRTIDSRRWR